VTIVLVDHDMNLMLSLCDHLYVLDFGSVIASGTPEEIRTDEKVTSAYLGAAPDAAASTAATSAASATGPVHAPAQAS
jgi:ABC-type cobalamin/Fe3+-siderophores transport system ATPase subunit